MEQKSGDLGKEAERSVAGDFNVSVHICLLSPRPVTPLSCPLSAGGCPPHGLSPLLSERQWPGDRPSCACHVSSAFNTEELKRDPHCMERHV